MHKCAIYVYCHSNECMTLVYDCPNGVRAFAIRKPLAIVCEL